MYVCKMCNYKCKPVVPCVPDPMKGREMAQMDTNLKNMYIAPTLFHGFTIFLFRFPFPLVTVVPKGCPTRDWSDDPCTFHSFLDAEKVDSCHLIKQLRSQKQSGALHSTYCQVV